MRITDFSTLSIHEVEWRLTCARFSEWWEEDLFHWRWWFLVLVFILSAWVWWRLVDKARLDEIVLCGAFIVFVTLVLDELGEELSFWYYPVDVFPLFPPLTAIDLASLPLVYSMIYQFCPGWGKFTIVTVLMAAVFCFVFEPFFVWVGVYQPLSWKYYYGFPIYIVMALCAKGTIAYLYRLEKRV